MFDDMLTTDIISATYDAHFISISKLDQFGSRFVNTNPVVKSLPQSIDRRSMNC